MEINIGLVEEARRYPLQKCPLGTPEDHKSKASLLMEEAMALIIEKLRYEMLQDVDMNAPLDPYKVLWNANHPVTKYILKLYSLETFLPQLIYESQMSKDVTKVPTLGPFLSALVDIVSECEAYRDESIFPIYKSVEPMVLYRCTQMTLREVRWYEELLVKAPAKRHVCIHGFLSAFESKELILNYLEERSRFAQVELCEKMKEDKVSNITLGKLKKQATKSYMRVARRASIHSLASSTFFEKMSQPTIEEEPEQ